MNDTKISELTSSRKVFESHITVLGTTRYFSIEIQTENDAFKCMIIHLLGIAIKLETFQEIVLVQKIINRACRYMEETFKSYNDYK